MTFTTKIDIINGCAEPKFSFMTNSKKNIDRKPTASKAEQGEKTADDVFRKMKGYFEPAKVDAFQKKWLAIPENRKKYSNMTDAPQVAAEEMLAMANDFVDFIQGQEGGKSSVLKKIKTKTSGFFKNHAKFLKENAEAVKKSATTGSSKISGTVGKSKGGIKKAGGKASAKK